MQRTCKMGKESEDPEHAADDALRVPLITLCQPFPGTAPSTRPRKRPPHRRPTLSSSSLPSISGSLLSLTTPGAAPLEGSGTK